MKAYVILFNVLLWGSFSVISQNFDWNQMIRNGSTYTEIWDVAMMHFDSVGRGRGTGYKQFMRWSAMAKYSVDNNDFIVNTQAANRSAYLKLIRQTQQDQQRILAGEWEALGPFDYTDPYANGGAMGRTSRLAFHPTDPARFFVGTATGGIWKTINSGNTWAPISDAMSNLGVGGLVVDQTNPNIMYLLTGDGDGRDLPSIGVLKSTDAGSSWSTTGLVWNNNIVNAFALVMDYSDNNTLLVGTSIGIFRTTNGGASWTNTWTSTVWDIEQDVDDPNTFYAASDSTLLKSTNAGLSWQVKQDPDFPDVGTYQRMAIAISPSAPSNMYAIFGGDTDIPGVFHGVFKSTNNGEGFTEQATTPNILGWETDGSDDEDQAERNLTIVVHPTNDALVFTGGVNVWKSQNHGNTWEAVTDWRRINPGLPWIHADQLDMKFNNGTLYVCADGGVYSTSNEGDDWAEISTGLAITQYYYIDVVNDNYTGGSQDNGTTSTSVGNDQATVIFGGDGFGCVYHYGNTSITYVSNQDDKVRRQFGVATEISPYGLSNFWDSDMDMHTTDPDYLFVAHPTDIFRGNGGISAGSWTWDSLETIFTSSTRTINTITQGVNDPSVMYASNDVQIIKTTNLSSAAISWEVLTEHPDAPNAVTDIVVDPADAERIWVCYGGYVDGAKVFYSNDGGSFWYNISGSLPNTRTHCLLYWPGSDDGIYIGTDLGVFYKSATMTDWEYFSNGLPAVIVKDMDEDNGYLYAGTYGRGLWRTEPFTGCPTDIVLTQANDPSTQGSTGQQTYSVTNSLTSSRIISGGTGTDVKYYTENFISLVPGFWARPGNLWQAKIKACPE